VVCGLSVIFLASPDTCLPVSTKESAGMDSSTNQTVYPFYILHLVIILVLGYYFKNVEMCFIAKFSIMTIGTFGITWLIYEFGIRRFACIRPLFGMKRKRLDNMDKMHSNFI